MTRYRIDIFANGDIAPVSDLPDMQILIQTGAPGALTAPVDSMSVDEKTWHDIRDKQVTHQPKFDPQTRTISFEPR